MCSLVRGALGDKDDDVIIVGGNCFLQTLSAAGEELSWNVMSDEVTALALIDYDGDGHQEVVIHSYTRISLHRE